MESSLGRFRAVYKPEQTVFPCESTPVAPEFQGALLHRYGIVSQTEIPLSMSNPIFCVTKLPVSIAEIKQSQQTRRKKKPS